MDSIRFADLEFQDECDSRQNHRITQLEQRVGCLETALRGEKKMEKMDIKRKLHGLSDEAAIEFAENGNITLWDTRTCAPKRVTIITYDEMLILTDLFEDGCCPVCMTEIPLNDIVCDECLARAQQAR